MILQTPKGTADGGKGRKKDEVVEGGE